MNKPPYPNPENRMPVLFDPITKKFVIGLATPTASIIPGKMTFVSSPQFSGKTLEEAVANYEAYVVANKKAEENRQRNIRAALTSARRNSLAASNAAQKTRNAQAKALQAKQNAEKAFAQTMKNAKNRNRNAKSKRNALRASCGWKKGWLPGSWTKPKVPSNAEECQGL